ncbi:MULTISPECIES: hypothetical protein [Paenibacillus]|uniref:hypothetical protein n=1 Tax=Paenibacillus TaxID=44249 RepID=UPI000AEB643A|nr:MULTISPECIES: hypothetical protein [Paenibacillus]WFA83413.1 hypothetical protein OGI70_20605 [Paenibacillus amylolyticus]
MQVERIFNIEHKMSFEDIMQTLIDEKVDSLIRSYYDHNQVNTVTSHDERKNAA